MGTTMEKCLLAIGLLIGFNISAEAARTCSHAMFECKAFNARLGEAAQAQCDGYFKVCMRTGSYRTKKWTRAGLLKQ
jgi:hypothetical protein